MFACKTSEQRILVIGQMEIIAKKISNHFCKSKMLC